jgi:uncharacterized protein YjbJ (UPF0337 family)
MDHDRELGPRTAPVETKGNLNQSAGKAEGTRGDGSGKKRVKRRATEGKTKGTIQEGISRAKEAVDDLADR